MSKMSRALVATGLVAAFAWSVGAGPAGASVARIDLAQAVANSDVVVLAQQRPPGGKKQRKAGGGKKTPKLSKEHQDQIRQHVPSQYHQYIPGMGGAGGGAPGIQ